jgi:hypothetical protein
MQDLNHMVWVEAHVEFELFHVARMLSLKLAKRDAFDDAQRFQTEQYPLPHARRLLRPTPSTRLVLWSVDQDVFGDIVSAVF